MQDRQRVWNFFAHASIIAGMVFVVFFGMDLFHPATEFLTSSISRWLILILALCAVANGLYSAIFLFQVQKRRDKKRNYPHARQTEERAYAQQRQQNEFVSSPGYLPYQERTVERQTHMQPADPVGQSGYRYVQRDSYRG